MKPARQISRDEARALFDYRDGKLYWRHVSSGHRADSCAISLNRQHVGKRLYHRMLTRIGGEVFSSHYIVWNWHHGLTNNAIVFRDGDPTNCAIDNLVERQRGYQNFIDAKSSLTNGDDVEEIIHATSSLHNNCCPTCAQAVSAPTYDFIVQHLNLQPLHARILRAVWDGKGHPVMPGKIFDYMYEDDPDGGPSDAMMYANFKVALCRLRARLEGSGVGIENAGYRAGYRLVLKGK